MIGGTVCFSGRRIKEEQLKKGLPTHQNIEKELPTETKEHKKCRISSLD